MTNHRDSEKKRLGPVEAYGAVEVLRGRPPEFMQPLLAALGRHKGLLTWLVPNKRCVGVPSFANADVVSLTIIDDLDPAASGPGSFDRATLLWWSKRATMTAIDPSGPLPRDPEPLAKLLRAGFSALLVQTPEARRVAWKEFLWGVDQSG